MSPKHIAFFPFPHHPHILPTLAFVSALARRGYRVTYVAPDIFEVRVKEAGAHAVISPRFINMSGNGRPICTDLFALTDQTIDTVAAFYEGNRPDLVIYDRACLAGRLLARRWGTQAATSTSVLAFELANPEVLGESARKWRDVLMMSHKERDVFMTQRGIENANTFFHKEDLNIHLYPRIYQVAGSVFDERDFYAGRCAAELPCWANWQPKWERRGPTVLVATSTAYIPGPQYFKMCIEALSELQGHVILSIGDRMDANVLGVLPPNFEVVQGIPQVKVMPYVDLFICKAGPASAAEAMYHGVPMLMITHGDIDPESYAENAERLGMGLHLRGEISAARLRTATYQMLQQKEFFDRMKLLSGITRREPGGEETANRIEEYLRR
ncbi:nucleotide disphospho-sugar-binding domain-containing protein [Peristeroidobacter soli]|uniref:nucleotide disphospho-sugar-binding domain-containing protein n=1 Tax=Peristeroidobacter soli TaxID=2497877 RepID=UPI00101C0BE1|nr:nucleotide disphospho-sugar-binding domain-containing protein [Peristeroidobacter soli]